MKKILIINTGGTIDCADTGSGLAPQAVSAAEKLLREKFGESAELEVMRTMCLDSSDMQPEHWLELARAVERQQWRFDGILITHGTDTMAYSASALWFMLGGLRIPVVFTGSQLPVFSEQSDAPRNLSDAMAVLLLGITPSVYVVFGGRIISGRRAVKRSSTSPDAFMSVNFPEIGTVESGEVRLSGTLDINGGEIAIGADSHVLLVKIAPGLEPGTIYAAKALGYRAVLIEGYGTDGIPSKLRNFLPAIKHLTENDVVVALTTQCSDGICELRYEESIKCAEYGLVCAGAMTTEAALVKLMWLCRSNASAESVRAEFVSDNF